MLDTHPVTSSTDAAEQEPLPKTNMEPQVEETQQPGDLILLSALKLFAEKGFFNTSLPEIAQAAGLKNAAAIQPYFKTKQAIAAQLYSQVLESLGASVDAIRSRNPKPAEQLRGIFDLLFTLAEDAPEVLRFLLTINIREILPDAQMLMETPPFVKMAKIFQAGMKDGQIRTFDVQVIQACFWGIISQALVQLMAGTWNKNSEHYRSQIWLTAWGAIAKK